METERLYAEDVEVAAEIIRSGGVVGIPTETVYGLGVDAMNEQAVERLYEAKHRPLVKPINVLVTGMGMAETLCAEIPPVAYTLAGQFWPGPLTMIFRDNGRVARMVLAGGETLGVRCPDHPLTLALLEAVGRPLATPSANLSGEPSPKNAGAVLESLNGWIDAVVDGGPCTVGVESTIVDFTKEVPAILREGGLSVRVMRRAMGGMKLDTANMRSVRPIHIFGVTGGTGCGKTTALRVMEELNIRVIDCDEVYHQMLASGGELCEALRVRFGAELFDRDGQLDRKSLGRMVFADSAALEELNGITHRHISLEVNRRIGQAVQDGCAAVAVDAIALLEGGFGRQCDATIGILAPQALRAARIMARENLSEEYALSRVMAQKPDSYYRDNCDFILENNGDLGQFQLAVRRLINGLLEDCRGEIGTN